MINKSASFCAYLEVIRNVIDTSLDGLSRYEEFDLINIIKDDMIDKLKDIEYKNLKDIEYDKFKLMKDMEKDKL